MQNAGICGLGQSQFDPVIGQAGPRRSPRHGRRPRGRRGRQPGPGGCFVPLFEPGDDGDPPIAHGEHLPAVRFVSRAGGRAAGHLQADQDPVPRHQRLGHPGAGAGRPAALVPGEDLCTVPARRYRVAGQPPPHARVQQLRVGVQVSCFLRQPDPPGQPLNDIRGTYSPATSGV